MKIYPKCIPCLLKRAYYEVNLANANEEQKYEAMKQALNQLNKNFSDKNATFEVSTEMHRSVYDAINTNDPYKEKKEQGNEVAEKLFEPIKRKIEKSNDGFRKTIIASILGNELDFGVLEHKVGIDNMKNDFPKKLKKADLGINDVRQIKKEIKKAKEISFVVDNCGEVFFDKLLINEIKKISNAKITLYVRGEPIFNDVTLKEAEEVGITEIVDEVKELGERAVGFHPDYVPKEIRNELFSADLVLSKGMANYESFSEFEEELNIAYIFKTKCEPVADSIGAEVGENIACLRKNN